MSGRVRYLRTSASGAGWHGRCSERGGMGYREFRRAFRVEVTAGVTTCLLGDHEVQLKDLGPGGFLVHSPTPVPLSVVHQVRFATADGWNTTLSARSVHSRQYARGNSAPVYAVGFAFVVNPAEGTDDAVAHLIDKVTSVLSFD